MEVPSQPWHTVGADLFQFKGKWHLLVTDFYSKAPFVRYVQNTSAQAAIKAMKGIFAENGVPTKIVSDNGPHFAAHQYSAFAKKWGFEIILSSPEYPQGHALIERHIQTIKKCMYKCDASGYDFDLAMLVLRSTPLDADLPSPAELLQQRRFRTTLPVYVPDPQLSMKIRQKLKEKQKKAAANYDKTAKEKVELTPGQPVRLYNKDTKRWEPAVIEGRAATPRSYYVQRMKGGSLLRRNRIQLKPTIENWGGRRVFHPTGAEEEDDSYAPSDTPPDTREEGMSAAVAPSPTARESSQETERVMPKPILRQSTRKRTSPDFFQAGSRK